MSMKYIIVLLLLTLTPCLFAQEDRDTDAKDNAKIDEIEGLFEDEGEKEVVRSAQRSQPAQEKKVVPKKVSELKILETFSDIAVIQRRFLPKTGRFEAYIAGGTNLNDAFFVGNGLQGRFGYYLSERWGIEAVASLFNNSDREVTQELKDRGVQTLGQVSTDTFYGIDIKWTPIYGKYAYFNEKIVPFDLYFSFGLGITDPKIGEPEEGSNLTVQDPGQPLTIRFGTGQIFALTKWMAFRWDLSWHFFNVQSPIDDSESLQNNLFLNLGISFFFPEAKYR